MLQGLVVDALAWIVVFFFVASWTQNIAALILAHLYYSRPKQNKCCVQPETLPGVSIIKPLTGSDDLLHHNLETWFKIDYPLFELLFCVHSPEDTSIPVVFDLMKQYPDVDAKLIVSGTSPQTMTYSNGTSFVLPLLKQSTFESPQPCSRTTPLKSGEDDKSPVYCCCKSCYASPNNRAVVNPKISNMLPAYESAKFDYVFLSDCYIEAEADSIRDAVERMGPRVGSVCQMHFVKDPPSPDRKTFGSAVNKVLFGTHNAKSILFLNFMRAATTVSAAMLIRKEALEECGGLRAFGCYLAEDFQMGLALAKRGWKNVLGRKLAWQNPALTNVDDVFSRVVRWKRLRQTTMPILLIAEPMAECIMLAITMPITLGYLTGLNTLFPMYHFAAIHVLAWFFTDYLLLSTINNQPLGFSKQTFLLAWLARELAAPLLQLDSMKSRCVTWRNQQFYIRLGGFTERLPSPLACRAQNGANMATPHMFAVKSFTSTPSDASTVSKSSPTDCVIDFVTESPIVQTPSSGACSEIEPMLGGKLFYAGNDTADQINNTLNSCTKNAFLKINTTPFTLWSQHDGVTPLQAHKQRQH